MADNNAVYLNAGGLRLISVRGFELTRVAVIDFFVRLESWVVGQKQWQRAVYF
jgi:hypothetical protein